MSDGYDIVEVVNYIWDIMNSGGTTSGHWFYLHHKYPAPGGFDELKTWIDQADDHFDASYDGIFVILHTAWDGLPKYAIELGIDLFDSMWLDTIYLILKYFPEDRAALQDLYSTPGQAQKLPG